MIKTIKIAILLIVVSNVIAKGQVHKTNDFLQKMREKVQDSTSTFFYKKLLNKIETEPGSITQQELYYLYYGQITLNKPTGMPFFTNGIDDFMNAVVKRKNKTIVELGLNLLKNNPVDLTILMHTALAIQKTKQSDDAFLDKWVKMLFDVILSTGDGKTKETPIKVADIQDSAVIKNFVRFKSEDEEMTEGNSIPLTVWVNGNKKLYIENAWAYL